MRVSYIRIVCVLGILVEFLNVLTITGGRYPSNGRIVKEYITRVESSLQGRSCNFMPEKTLNALLGIMHIKCKHDTILFRIYYVIMLPQRRC